MKFDTNWQIPNYTKKKLVCSKNNRGKRKEMLIQMVSPCKLTEGNERVRNPWAQTVS